MKRKMKERDYGAMVRQLRNLVYNQGMSYEDALSELIQLFNLELAESTHLMLLESCEG